MQCLGQSPAVRVRRLSPDTFPQYSQQYTATDGPGAGPSKHLPTSATSHAGRPSDQTGSSLRESNTGHRHATHRCHTILQIHRQPCLLSPPKPLVKDWSPFAARQSPRRFAQELSCLVLRRPAGADHCSLSIMGAVLVVVDSRPKYGFFAAVPISAGILISAFPFPAIYGACWIITRSV